MTGLEAMLAALGPAADSFFETDDRRPSLLLPPSVFNTDTPDYTNTRGFGLTAGSRVNRAHFYLW